MKKVIWNNQDLNEPLCFDDEGNVLEFYDEEKIGQGEVMIDDEGYGYYIPPGAEYPQEGYCMEGQNFGDYIDENHQPEEL